MAGSSKKRLCLTDYTVAIICPLEVEMSAMRYMLDEEHARLPRVEGDMNSYVFGELCGHNVVIGFLPYGDQGIGIAATVATHMKRTFPGIKLRLLVGLAGGIPSQINDIRLGDVIISMPVGVYSGVVQYDLGKETIDGFERKGSLEPPPKEWRDAVLLMMSDHRVSGNQITTYIAEMTDRHPQLSTYRYPAYSQDRLFVSDYVHASGHVNCDNCDMGQLVSRRSRKATRPAVFAGLIASGDRVIKNGEVRDKISQQAGGALCFEMEAAGLMNDFRCFVIRGICDYADSHKNDEWHAYGAAVAAGCAKEILTYIEPQINRSDTDFQSTHTKYFVIPKQTVKDFVGREEELKKIKTYFTSASHDRVRVVVIHALGGQGKSQLALECCYRLRDEYRGVFWVNASSTSAATQSLSGIAQELDETQSLQGNDEDTKVRFVLRTLSMWKDRWLVVYDNCDDPNNFNSIRNLIPNVGRGDVLLTSRHRGLESLGMLLELPSMPVHAGVALLLSAYPGIDARDYMDIGTKIVNRLGGLALAIKQAAAYIQYREMPVADLGDFINLYESHRAVILQHTPDTLWEYGALHADQDTREKAINAFTTWEMSLQFLCPRDPKRQKAILHILTLAAFLAPTPIYESIFEVYLVSVEKLPDWAYIFLGGHSYGVDKVRHPAAAASVYPKPDGGRTPRSWNQEKFWDFVQTTKKHCLTQGTAKGHQPGIIEFSLHPLIRDWLQLREKGQVSSRFVSEAVTMITYSIKATERSEPQEQSLLAHTDAILELDAEHNDPGARLGDKLNDTEVAKKLSEFYLRVGRYDMELRLKQSIYSSHLKELGANDRYTQDAAYIVGWALYRNRQYDKTLHTFRENLQARKRIFGVNHPKTINSMAAVCDILVYSMSFQPRLMKEAESVTKELLALDYKILGVCDRDRLRTMRGLAHLLAIQRKNEAAEAMFREVLELSRKSLGTRDAGTIIILHDLSSFFVDIRKYSEAERCIHKLLALYEDAYHTNHPLTLQGRATLAYVLGCRKEYDASVNMYEMILQAYQEQGLDGNIDALSVFRRLALSLTFQERYHDATNVMRKGTIVCYKAHGASSPETKACSATLVTILRRSGMDEYSISKTLLELLSSLGMPNREVQSYINELTQPTAPSSARYAEKAFLEHNRPDRIVPARAALLFSQYQAQELHEGEPQESIRVASPSAQHLAQGPVRQDTEDSKKPARAASSPAPYQGAAVLEPNLQDNTRLTRAALPSPRHQARDLSERNAEVSAKPAGVIFPSTQQQGQSPVKQNAQERAMPAPKGKIREAWQKFSVSWRSSR